MIYWDYANSTSGRLLHTPTPTGFTNVWNHLAFVASQSGNYMRIFRNGVQVASKVGMTPRTLGNFDLLIGNSSSLAFGGNIDELRIWNTARSTNEILTNMNRRLSGSEPNLVLYFHADEGSGTTTTDATGHGFTGNLLSGATFVASGAPIGPPVVTTLAATAVTNTTATANANVNPVAQASGVYFEYGLTTNYTATTSVTNLAAGSNTVAVSKALTGLVGGTTYQIRAVATTLAATGVGATGATLNGTVNANGVLTGAYFQYGFTTNYGTVAAVVGTFNGTGTAAVANAISSLTPGQTYHFRLVATNANGTGYGGDLTFNTPAAAPTANTLAASAVTATNATLNSTVSGNGAATTAYFEWGQTTGYGTTTGPQAVSAGAVNAAINASIAGLQPGVTYHFRSVASNSVGTTPGGDQQFTTPPLAPVVVSVPASGVSGQTATLNGTVTANGAATTVAFQWGTTTGYGNTTSPQVFPGGTVAGSFNELLAGLQPVTTYHFRAVATNSGGTSLGGDQIFNTPPVAPAIATLAASGVTSSAATLNGTVTANGAATGVYFEWGTTTNYGTLTSAQNFATNAANAAASRALSGLAPGTTYYFRAVATNSVGTNVGAA